MAKTNELSIILDSSNVHEHLKEKTIEELLEEYRINTEELFELILNGLENKEDYIGKTIFNTEASDRINEVYKILSGDRQIFKNYVEEKFSYEYALNLFDIDGNISQKTIDEMVIKKAGLGICFVLEKINNLTLPNLLHTLLEIHIKNYEKLEADEPIEFNRKIRDHMVGIIGAVSFHNRDLEQRLKNDVLAYFSEEYYSY